MIYKKQILVFIVSFLIAGFFLLSTAELGFSGTNGQLICCQFPDKTTECENILDCVIGSEVCDSVSQCLTDGDPCTCIEPPPAIPTLSQWGMFIMAGVLGLFAVIGLFVMRRRSPVKT